MRIKLTSLMVDDQDKALAFYTDVLGFRKKHEIPAGGYRWITVVAPDAPGEAELSLEPNANPAAKTFQQAMFAQKIPLAAFEVDDIESEHQRLKAHGVVFTTPPTPMGPVTLAVFSDTCGNLIQIYQPQR
jgi:catechol 2,3-dioxygenase-like lactoylglutathione lyase family enzyme